MPLDSRLCSHHTVLPPRLSLQFSCEEPLSVTSANVQWVYPVRDPPTHAPIHLTYAWTCAILVCDCFQSPSVRDLAAATPCMTMYADTCTYSPHAPAPPQALWLVAQSCSGPNQCGPLLAYECSLGRHCSGSPPTQNPCSSPFPQQHQGERVRCGQATLHINARLRTSIDTLNKQGHAQLAPEVLTPLECHRKLSLIL